MILVNSVHACIDILAMYIAGLTSENLLARGVMLERHESLAGERIRAYVPTAILYSSDVVNSNACFLYK